MPAPFIAALVAAFASAVRYLISQFIRNLVRNAVVSATQRLTQGFTRDRLKGDLIAWSGEFEYTGEDFQPDDEEPDIDNLTQLTDETDEDTSEYDNLEYEPEHVETNLEEEEDTFQQSFQEDFDNDFSQTDFEDEGIGDALGYLLPEDFNSSGLEFHPTFFEDRSNEFDS